MAVVAPVPQPAQPAATERGLRLRRLTLFGTIYFVEGAILTFFSAFNVLYLRSFDISFTRIGIVSGISLIPFVLKIFIGLLSDRFSLFGLGHRRPYIILGLALQAVPFLLVPLIDPSRQFWLYAAACLVAALGMSTYDTTTDGMSIDLTPPAERPQVQSVMVGGRALSAVLIASVFGFLSQRNLWPATFILIGVLAILTIPLVFTVSEPRQRPAGKQFTTAAFKAFWNLPFLLFILLGLIYPLALYSANGMIGAFLNEVLGVSLGRVGVYISVFGLGTIAGALGGAALMKRVGRRNGVLSALVLTSAVTFCVAVAPSPLVAWGVVFLFGVAFGYYETVYMAVAMDFSDPRIAAFMYSIIMAFGNIGIGAGAPIAGILVDAVGFRLMFSIFAVANLLALPLVFAVFKLRKDLR